MGQIAEWSGLGQSFFHWSVIDGDHGSYESARYAQMFSFVATSPSRSLYVIIKLFSQSVLTVNCKVYYNRLVSKKGGIMHKPYAQIKQEEDNSVDYTAYAIVEREWDDEDEVLGDPMLYIVDVPPVNRQVVKDALVKAKRTFGDPDKPWRNYTLLSADKWNLDTQMAYDAADSLIVTFDDLLMEANGERKMTLKVPVSLHQELAELSKKAGQNVDEYCLDILKRHVIMGGDDSMELSHRDAMRALYRIYGDDKDAIVNGWVRLFELTFVRIKKNPNNNPPTLYSQQLYQDAINKKWLEQEVEDSIVQVVRQALQEKSQ